MSMGVEGDCCAHSLAYAAVGFLLVMSAAIAVALVLEQLAPSLFVILRVRGTMKEVQDSMDQLLGLQRKTRSRLAGFCAFYS